MLKKSFLAVFTLMILTACGDKYEEKSPEALQKIIDEGTVGFETADGVIKKAENVPADEEKAIFAAFNEYVKALDSEEIERYMRTISKNPKGFNLEEEKEFVAENFEQYDVKRDVKDSVITKYSDNEVEVTADITAHLTELKTNGQHVNSRRQITVFVKEDGEWKVSSVFAYSGNYFPSNKGN
ncbi:hypothetical protein ABE61_12325 [Lysinibacillus sphaericus]|uniref:DUF3225 domain-containing protein n=1 Tax=Lysinibacillus sphaericus TaxID=1421 RepID=UPI0018CD9876|nr:DUF3225 domain-containing protein [Lysinibacillus sphaericus]MBG9454808.1 hypothetical protein [Lysinibacillus sphaericus]MBG9478236.1 hypothetical protein [Lysinibacillus sphaericus]MBG9590949.1 hypothetical protein [Lysinibacillus sphaericus]